MISACQHFKQQKVSVPRQGDATQLWDCWEATGRQPQSLTGHLDFRKVKKKKKSPTGCPHHPCPVHRHQSAASCELRTAFAASSPLLSFQHFDAEKKGTERGVGSTFLFHLTFKSHLHQLQPFICTIQPELSNPLQIRDGQREKSSPSFPARATRMLPRGRRGLGSKPAAAQTAALSSGLCQPESLLLNIKRKRTESLLQKGLCLSASGQVTDVRHTLQSLCIH